MSCCEGHPVVKELRDRVVFVARGLSQVFGSEFGLCLFEVRGCRDVDVYVCFLYPPLSEAPVALLLYISPCRGFQDFLVIICTAHLHAQASEHKLDV